MHGNTTPSYIVIKLVCLDNTCNTAKLTERVQNLVTHPKAWLTVVCETKWNETKWDEMNWKSVVCEMKICSLRNENSVVCEMKICRAVTKSGTGTWDVRLGDAGTRGRRDSWTWYARTSELGDARGFEDVINK